jgi:hypothetical protein
MCEKVIAASTASAINGLPFFDISKERLELLLTTERLNIPSELVLIGACISWTKHNHRYKYCYLRIAPINNRKLQNSRLRDNYSEVMRSFLPYVRFLSLHPEEFSANVSSFDWLTDSEKLAILVNITTSKDSHKMPLSAEFCKCKVKRSFSGKPL